jgi:hypothetical protein
MSGSSNFMGLTLSYHGINITIFPTPDPDIPLSGRKTV